MAKPAATGDGDVSEAFRLLLKAGVELGVAEAVRRIIALAPGGDRLRGFEAETALGAAVLAEVVQSMRQDPGSVFQLVKEVWSRGGPKERKTAARALGRGLSRLEPHRAAGLSRDLASMARNAREADVVGTEAIGPLLTENPGLYDRMKQLLTDNERWVRRAAIAGLVVYVTHKKRVAGLALEVILLLAENNEDEVRTSVRRAIKEISKVDWRATAGAITAWVATNPTRERIQMAKRFAGSAAGDAKRQMQKVVFVNLAKLANGNGKR